MGMLAWIRKKLNFEDFPSAKIGSHENFPLYGSNLRLFCGSLYHIFAMHPLCIPIELVLLGACIRKGLQFVEVGPGKDGITDTARLMVAWAAYWAMLFSHTVAPGGPRLLTRAGRGIIDWVVVTTDISVAEVAVVCVILVLVVVVVAAPLAADIACCNLVMGTDFQPVDWRPSLVQYRCNCGHVKEDSVALCSS